jgi:hypothetical protein
MQDEPPGTRRNSLCLSILKTPEITAQAAIDKINLLYGARP